MTTTPAASVHPRVCGELPMTALRISALRTVHPRVCGELTAELERQLALAGSSPRVRGTRFRRYALSNSNTVHPRVCGELVLIADFHAVRGGSSPRVRGTLHHHRRRRPLERFIPACAGNSKHWNQLMRELPVHPRVCGELEIGPVFGGRDGGSSPRVRGTRKSGGRSRRLRRFIPACAGNSQPPALPVAGVVGSSPRVRGTQQIVGLAPRQRRFIPACAGNSGGARLAGVPRAVHPRVCGELCSLSDWPKPWIGSSPRVRGTRRRGARQRRRRLVHPRVCGELISRR